MISMPFSTFVMISICPHLLWYLSVHILIPILLSTFDINTSVHSCNDINATLHNYNDSNLSLHTEIRYTSTQSQIKILPHFYITLYLYLPCCQSHIIKHYIILNPLYQIKFLCEFWRRKQLTLWMTLQNLVSYLSVAKIVFSSLQ